MLNPEAQLNVALRIGILSLVEGFGSQCEIPIGNQREALQGLAIFRVAYQDFMVVVLRVLLRGRGELILREGILSQSEQSVDLLLLPDLSLPFKFGLFC